MCPVCKEASTQRLAARIRVTRNTLDQLAFKQVSQQSMPSRSVACSAMTETQRCLALQTCFESSVANLSMWEVLLWRGVNHDFCDVVNNSAAHLTCRRCLGQSKAGSSLLNAMKNLQSINLRDSPMIDDRFVTSHLQNRSCLTALDLSFCTQITQLEIFFPDMNVSGLFSSELTSLKMAGTKLTDRALVRVLQSCPKLIHLDVTLCNQLSDKSLGTVGLLATLQTMALANCKQLTSAGVVRLAQCGTLTTLNLAGCSVDDEALLEVMRRNRQISAINLTHCHQLTDQWLRPLCTQPHPLLKHACRSLTSLNISDCPTVSDDAIRELIAKRPEIELLGIRSRRVATPRRTSRSQSGPARSCTPVDSPNCRGAMKSFTSELTPLSALI